ncbi:uncharacterized protein B0J16DRAFT_383426 [Fusarium flagelliforme]|uniref:Uncharacterized protein n=1 Tax=Fusarium flagelliforme TaxID=2675880 RepID=A0A395MQ90_9HYPO|nr:uncharacterized protein B0J16DRAFT_383426 [Fusarium flagelliforme]KAH7189562.1 hypothetical protein B0J16DRAFT_383426 [Fusarium flagelliforme]RFN50128.1 hypothetical protein FIE12Z_5656 [Fusarium flagelliforme]
MRDYNNRKQAEVYLTEPVESLAGDSKSLVVAELEGDQVHEGGLSVWVQGQEGQISQVDLQKTRYGQTRVPEYWDSFATAEQADGVIDDKAINATYRSRITIGNKHEYRNTVFAQRATGHGLQSQLLHIFRNDKKSKELSC